MRYIALNYDGANPEFFILQNAGELAKHRELKAFEHEKWDYYELGHKA